MTRRDARLLAAGFILFALSFLHPFLTGRSQFIGDVLYSFHPWFTYAAQNLQGGRLPLWNPYSSCGEPFLANPQTMLFFPLAQLFWLFPFGAAWRLILAAGQFLLWGAAYSLALRWTRGKRAGAVLAAAALTWGGYAVVHWEFPGATAALPLVPLFLLFALTDHRASLALTTALLFFAGYTPFAYYAAMVGTAAVLWQTVASRRDPASPPATRRLLFGAAALAAGLSLALVQILPAWEVTSESLRTRIGDAEARAFLLTPVFLVKFLLPALFDKVALPFTTPVFPVELWPVQRNWLNTYFLGVATFLFAATRAADLRRRRTWFWGAVTLFGLAMSMGWEPLFSLTRRAVPGMAYMTHFSSFMLLPVMAAAFLAAEGWEDVPGRRVRWAVPWGAAAALCAGLAASPVFRRILLRALLGTDDLTPAQHHAVAGAALTAGAFLALWLAVTRIRAAHRRAAAMAALLLGELWLFGHDLAPVTDDSFFHRPVPLARREQGGDARLAFSPETLGRPQAMEGASLVEGYQSVRQVLRPNTQIPFRVHGTWGYEVFPLRRFVEYRRIIPPDAPLGAPLDFVGARRIVSSRPMPTPATLIARAPHAYLYENPGALPRVTWVPNAVSRPDPVGRLEYLSTAWRPSAEVVLEMPWPAVAAGDASNAPRLTWRDGPAGRLEVVGSGRKGWLVWSVPHYPGWEAYVDGQRVPLRRANHAFQAIETPNGEWRAAFLYRPALFRSGLMISVLGILTMAAWAWRRAAGLIRNRGAVS